MIIIISAYVFINAHTYKDSESYLIIDNVLLFIDSSYKA